MTEQAQLITMRATLNFIARGDATTVASCRRVARECLEEIGGVAVTAALPEPVAGEDAEVTQARSELTGLAIVYDCELELRPQSDPFMGSPWEVYEHETGYVAGGEDPAGAVEGARRWLERCGRAPAKVRSWLDSRGIEYRRADDGSIWIAELLQLYYIMGSGWHWWREGNCEAPQLPAEGWEDMLSELLRAEL